MNGNVSLLRLSKEKFMKLLECSDQLNPDESKDIKLVTSADISLALGKMIMSSTDFIVGLIQNNGIHSRYSADCINAMASAICQECPEAGEKWDKIRQETNKALDDSHQKLVAFQESLNEDMKEFMGLFINFEDDKPSCDCKED